jgi:beta-lactamase class D
MSAKRQLSETGERPQCVAGRGVLTVIQGMTKKITLVATSGSGWTLHGKTGSGGIGAGAPSQASVLWLGWFVGHVAHGDRESVFVTSYSDRVESADPRPPGWIARDIATKILVEMGLY